MAYPRQSSFWRPDGTRKQFSVYVMSNTSMTLYTGVTNDVARRVIEHKNGTGSGFTGRYHFDRVVYIENYDLVVDAIAREKSIKGMKRAKKIALIKSVNPTWKDLLAATTSGLSEHRSMGGASAPSRHSERGGRVGVSEESQVTQPETLRAHPPRSPRFDDEG